MLAAVARAGRGLREQVTGALDLFRAHAGAPAPAGIRDTLNEQLQTALHSRVIIEQAEGKLAGRPGLDMDQAFSLLRDRARTSSRRLSGLARAVADGPQTLAGPAAGRSGQRLPDAGQVPAS